LHELII